jgi:hypothetical protein
LLSIEYYKTHRKNVKEDNFSRGINSPVYSILFSTVVLNMDNGRRRPPSLTDIILSCDSISELQTLEG